VRLVVADALSLRDVADTPADTPAFAVAPALLLRDVAETSDIRGETVAAALLLQDVADTLAGTLRAHHGYQANIVGGTPADTVAFALSLQDVAYTPEDTLGVVLKFEP
jgi:hypothetical protein